MRTIIAEANFVKITYFRMDERFSKVSVGIEENPITFTDKEDLFEDWSQVQELKIFDKELKEDFQNYLMEVIT
jgi:hypothetical protein